MKRALFSVLLFLLFQSCQQLPDELQQGNITFVPMETEQLPDLNEARSGHALVWAGDHILAIGGHTTGFVPTSTAEYYEGGRWHSMPTLYPHDTPFALVLKDGDVLVGGGYESIFGVGQTWGVECYHPATHTFSPKPIMDRKRAHASALELEDGSIVISGNWYATDGTEIFDGTGSTQRTDSTSDNRSYPFLLPVTKNNVWIVGGSRTSYNKPTNNMVDQLKGAPFKADGLAEWHLQTSIDRNTNSKTCRIAENAFLLLALNAYGSYAPMLVDSTGFSHLPMEQQLPKEGPWGAIHYFGSIWTSPESGTAWLMGKDEQNHVYLAEIQYLSTFQDGKAKLSMYYSQPLEAFPSDPWEMRLPDGSFVTVGGKNGSNFESSAAVYAFYPNGAPSKHAFLLPVGIGMAIAIGLLLVFVTRKRKSRQKEENVIPQEETVPSIAKPELGDKLKALMEEKQLFRNKNLRLADVATELCTNTTYLSACLNGELGSTFPMFVTSYRIRYAQELMRKDPSMRLSKVAEASGFANEKTFLRSFKAACGVTPSEWKQEHTFTQNSQNMQKL